MSHEVMVVCAGSKLTGKTAADAEVLDGLDGGTFRCVLTEPSSRSVSAIRLWWSVCGMIADNYPGDLTREAVSDVLKIQCGHMTLWKDAAGAYRRSPKSIAFNKMPQADFSALIDKALGAASELFGPGLAEAARAELARIAAPDLKEIAAWDFRENVS